MSELGLTALGEGGREGGREGGYGESVNVIKRSSPHLLQSMCKFQHVSRVGMGGQTLMEGFHELTASCKFRINMFQVI